MLRASNVGLNGIAILDHNDLRSVDRSMLYADKLKQASLLPDEFMVIPGVEVSSNSGHIGALFVNSAITKGLSIPETVDRIHDAGGLAIAVHPFLKSSVGDALSEVPFDAVEIETGSVINKAIVKKTQMLLHEPQVNNMAKLGSSDAHYVNSIGVCYTIVKTSHLSESLIRSAIVDRQCSPQITGTCHKLRRMANILAPRISL